MSRLKFFLFFRSSLVGNSLVIILCFFGIILLQRPKLDAIVNREQILISEQAQREAELEKTRLQVTQRMPAFGFDNLLANWEMLQFLQYFGDYPARQITGYPLIPDYFRIVLDRDPRFIAAYIFLGTSGAIHAGKPYETNEIMTRGIERLAPQKPKYSYFALRNRGINEILFLGDLEAAQETFTKAADWASTYDDPPSLAVAKRSRDTATFLASRPGLQSTQVAAWGMVLEQAPDEETQKIAIENIHRYGGRIMRQPNGRFQVILPSSP